MSWSEIQDLNQDLALDLNEDIVHDSPRILSDSAVFSPNSPQFSSGSRCIPHLCELGGTRSPYRALKAEVKLTGSGQRKDGCGKIIKVGACGNRHPCSEYSVHDWCYDRLCPDCWRAWASRESNIIIEKINAYDELCLQMSSPIQKTLNFKDGSGGISGFESLGQLRHFVVSPAQEWARERISTVGGYRYLRSELNRVLRLAGMRASVAVFHPWRTTERAGSEYKKALSNNEKYTKRGRWEWLKKTGNLGTGYIYFSPHFHVVGYGFLMPSNEFHEATTGRGRSGWVYKMIRSVEGDKDLRGLLMYVFSHAGVVAHCHTVTYQGELGPRSLRSRMICKKTNSIECPECEGLVVGWTGWSQSKEYDSEKGEDRYKFRWNAIDSDKPPLPLLDVMTWTEEKRDYWLKEFPQYHSIQCRGADPLLKHNQASFDQESPGDHVGHAFDHVSEEWIDEYGEVVE